MVIDDTKFICSDRLVNERMYELPDLRDETFPEAATHRQPVTCFQQFIRCNNSSSGQMPVLHYTGVYLM